MAPCQALLRPRLPLVGGEKGVNALHAKRWAMVIDTRQFTGPRDYEPLIEACHKFHNVPHVPGDQNIKWFWLDSFEHTFPMK